MKKVFLAAALSTGLMLAPASQAKAEVITLTVAEVVLTAVGSAIVGLHLDDMMTKHKAKHMVHSRANGVNLSANDVRGLQSYLNTAGCNAGAEDGIWGPRTSAAVARCF